MRGVATFLLVALCFATVSAARLRGAFDAPAQQVQQQQSPASQGELISFLQSHQRAFAAAGASRADPSEQAQQSAQSAQGEGADASGDNVLAALEHAPAHHSLVQTGAEAQVSEPGADGDGEAFGPCKTCVFVLERIKKGSNMLLPAICSELYHKYPDAYALCHQVLNALSINGNNVRYWLFEGCFKYEIYQSKEWIKPCPSHVMCSVLKDLSAAPFCPALPMENPFADA